MSTTPTFSGLISKQLEYREEPAFGDGAAITSGTLSTVGHVKSIDPRLEAVLEEFRRHGSEDPYKFLKVGENYSFSINYGIEASTFIKYGTQAQGGGTGTIDKSLGVGLGYKLNGTENFVEFEGVRHNSLEIRGAVDSSLDITSEFIAQNITTPSTTDYVSGTGAHATHGSSNPWTFTDGGTDPVSFNSVAYKTTAISVRFGRGLHPIRLIGNEKIQYLPPTNRSVSGVWSVVYFNTTPETALKAGTTANLVWVLKTATSTLTATNAKLRTLDSRTFNAGDETATIETYGFVAESASVT